MHKIIITGSLVLIMSFLASCTNPLAKTEDFAAVSNAHRTALLAKIAPESLMTPNGEVKLSWNINANTGSGTLELVFATDSQFAGLDSNTTLTLSGSVNTPELGGSTSMNLNMNALSKSGSGFLRINTLDLKTADPAISGMIWGFVGGLKGKWLLLDGETSTLDQSRNQSLVKEIQKTFADGNLIIMTQDLGVKNGEYNYEISIDKKELLKLQKTITQIQTGTGMTDAEIVIAQKTLDASSFSGTLTVNQSNKEFGSMILNYSIASAAPISGTVIADKTLDWSTGTNKPEMGSIRYDLSKDGIVLGFKNNDESIALDLKKNLTKYVGNLIVTDQSKTHIFPIEISKDGDAFVVSIKYTAPDKLEEIQSMNSNIRLNVIPKSNIVITAPTGATPISKIMWELLGGMEGVGEESE